MREQATGFGDLRLKSEGYRIPCRGVAKLVKASDFDSDMRRFESFFPCQNFFSTFSSNARTLPVTSACG